MSLAGLRSAHEARHNQWFGSFNASCSRIPLPLCPLVGLSKGQGGVPALCYARNVEIWRKLVFMPATLAIYIVAVVMSAIMIWHIKSKYTAVGRKEMVVFFYLYMLTTIVEFALVSNALTASNSLYPYFVAGHLALICAMCWSLLMNGFVGFQFIEDGTALSVWTLRLSSLLVFAMAYFVAGATFQGWLSWFDRSNPTVLWILYFIMNGASIFIYIVLQIILVLNTLQTRWPVGDILLGITFFGISFVFLFVFSRDICEMSRHYVDGLFFGTAFNLLAVMMVYKYWDDITKEDLEFSVGGMGGTWEVRENLLLDDDTMGVDRSYYEDASYARYLPPREPIVGGGAEYATMGRGFYGGEEFQHDQISAADDFRYYPHEQQHIRDDYYGKHIGDQRRHS